jgi:hypothetical protein
MSTPIDVVSIFRKKTVKPVKFKYAGRTHRIEKIMYAWITREGGFPVHHFSVITQDGNRFEISLRTYTMDWAIDESDLAAPETAPS